VRLGQTVSTNPSALSRPTQSRQPHANRIFALKNQRRADQRHDRCTRSTRRAARVDAYRAISVSRHVAAAAVQLRSDGRSRVCASTGAAVL
jgi:hypothetical protein